MLERPFGTKAEHETIFYGMVIKFYWHLKLHFINVSVYSDTFQLMLWAFYAKSNRNTQFEQSFTKLETISSVRQMEKLNFQFQLTVLCCSRWFRRRLKKTTVGPFSICSFRRFFYRHSMAHQQLGTRTETLNRLFALLCLSSTTTWKLARVLGATSVYGTKQHRTKPSANMLNSLSLSVKKRKRAVDIFMRC